MNTTDLEIIKGYAWLEETPGQFIVSFAKTYSLLESVLEDYYKDFGLSKAKFNVLYLLYKSNEGLCLNKIGEHMLVTKANITGLIDRLEKDEFVVRLSHPTDRRVTIAKITEKGQVLIEKIIPYHINLNSHLLNTLTEEDQQQMILLLETLYVNIKDLKNCK